MSEEKKYPFPVFATQGGGLVQEVAKGVYQFIEAPDPCTGLKVGDFKPDMWGIVAANKRAQEEVEGEMDEVMDMLYDDIQSRVP